MHRLATPLSTSTPFLSQRLAAKQPARSVPGRLLVARHLDERAVAVAGVTGGPGAGAAGGGSSGSSNGSSSSSSSRGISSTISSIDDAFTYSCEMSVRDYELDQYSVVNHAKFCSYLQHVRHKFLHTIGLDADAVARQGNALALSELNLKYLGPLRSGDRFRATCRVAKATPARVAVAQEIWRLPRRSGSGSDGSNSGSDGAGGSGNGSSSSAGGGSRGDEEEEEQLVLLAEATVVSLDSDYKPKRIPAAVREAMITGWPLRPEDSKW